MLLSVKDTLGYQIAAVDEDVGTLDDLLFDEASSKIRYLLIHTGSWLGGRSVLLAPAAFGSIQPGQRVLPTALTKQQVESSPRLDEARALSRAQEDMLYRHYGWVPYWEATLGAQAMAPSCWGAPARPGEVLASGAGDAQGAADPRLRSAREVTGYYVQAADREIGHLSDLLVDEHDWTIRLLVIDTRNWWPGRKVVVAPEWLERVDWPGQQIVVGLTRDQIKASPEYDPGQTLDRSYQERLYRHYGRPPYWR
jgi:hypothetical protein